MPFSNAAFVSVGKFKTREAWVHPSRRCAHHELIYVTEGTVCICEDFCEYRAKQGELLLLKRDRRHYGITESTGNVAFWRLTFDCEALDTQELQHFTPTDRDAVNALFSQLHRYDTTPEYPSVYADSVLRMLLCELHLFGAPSESHAFPARMAAYIRDRHGLLRVKDVAAHFDYNEDYISRIFKRIYKKGIKAYIDTVRLRYIKQFLTESDLPYQAIAEKTGFGDYTSMYCFFKYQTGMTLSAYQALYRDIGQGEEEEHRSKGTNHE